MREKETNPENPANIDSFLPSSLTIFLCGGDPGAFNGGGALPVAGGARAELPVPAESERVHLSAGGCEGQRVLPGPQSQRRFVMFCFVWTRFLVGFVTNDSLTHLPQAICVTTFPMSSNTFLGLISWFVELWPSCPYPPAPNVNTPPSCRIVDPNETRTDWWTGHAPPEAVKSARRHGYVTQITSFCSQSSFAPTLHDMRLGTNFNLATTWPGVYCWAQYRGVPQQTQCPHMRTLH